MSHRSKSKSEISGTVDRLGSRGIILVYRYEQSVVSNHWATVPNDAGLIKLVERFWQMRNTM